MKLDALFLAGLLSSACVVTTHEGPGEPPRVAPAPPPVSDPLPPPADADLESVPTAPEEPEAPSE